MRIQDFGVEMWMNAWETRCEVNIAETCIESVTVGELLALAGTTPAAFAQQVADLRLTYGAIEGSDRLRTAIASLYDGQHPGNIVVTHGAAGANALVHATLVEPGSTVVSVLPSYQQHYSIPESYGAQVRRVWLHEDRGWALDPGELADVARGADVIVLTNPSNPTGALLGASELDRVVAIARDARAWLVADEVYRGIEHHASGPVPSVADLYERGVATGSMSKAYSMAGVRLGWVTGPEPLIEQVCRHRDYDTISVGVVDDLLATLALEHRDALLDRNRAIVARNRAILAAWVDGRDDVTWVPPAAGTVTLLRFETDDSEGFCRDLLEQTGVLLTPGTCFEVEGTARIGFAGATEGLREGLSRLGAYLDARRRHAAPPASRSHTAPKGAVSG